MYDNKTTIDATAVANGGSIFATGVVYYWSSTEGQSFSAWGHAFFGGGGGAYYSKSSTYRVRSVRAF